MSVLSARTQRLLEAPVLPLLLTLAAPNIGEAAARITFLTADALFVSWLGSDALAGVAVVFPLFLVLQTATASGIGSGVSSAIGRALGAGDPARAQSLAGVGLAIALVGAVLTTALLLAFGPALYAAMGLKERALEMAIAYGAVLFGGSAFVWLQNVLANVSRGAGNMVVPAFSIAIGEAFHLALSPALITGWGPFPQLGILGAALAALSAYAVGTIVLVLHLVSRQALVRLRAAALRLRRDEAVAILRVGGLSAMSALMFQITTFFVAGLVASLGSAAVAGYGAAVRLELLQYPITFAFGSAVITMVATAVGAREFERARRAAWIGAAVAAAIGLIFTSIALAAGRWMGLFTTDPAVRELGVLYLHCQAVVFPFTGAALACYFATVGLGTVVGPFLLALLRLVVAVAGGWLALSIGDGPLGLFAASAVAFVAFAIGLLVITRRRFDALTRR
ncbi:MAG: MATE family efflux transporter [Reyranella sp.]|uniref:MATE family efflux transporter n=1 Tax=Reyranella sp. TaxID=1929291 RepID=UPI001AC8F0E0|nr:MATE family efflux transporter [Reyranella sp.]MBN9087427.1 MATE family efflux transporter [Reyranella sp.]